MPTTYTHYQFGDRVYPQLPEALKQAVLSHRALFDIGVHGPDPLFYYKPLQKMRFALKGTPCIFSRQGNFSPEQNILFNTRTILLYKKNKKPI